MTHLTGQAEDWGRFAAATTDSRLFFNTESRRTRRNAESLHIFIVADQVIVEAKSVLKMPFIFQARPLTYVKHIGIEVDLLINFNVEKLVDGVERLIRTAEQSSIIWVRNTISVKLRSLRVSVLKGL